MSFFLSCLLVFQFFPWLVVLSGDLILSQFWLSLSYFCWSMSGINVNRARQNPPPPSQNYTEHTQTELKLLALCVRGVFEGPGKSKQYQGLCFYGSVSASATAKTHSSVGGVVGSFSFGTFSLDSLDHPPSDLPPNSLFFFCQRLTCHPYVLFFCIISERTFLLFPRHRWIAPFLYLHQPSLHI